MTVADLVAADFAATLRSFGERAPGRFVAEVSGLLVVGLGVDEAWGTQVVATTAEPEPAAVDVAIDWCLGRGRVPQVIVRAQHRDLLHELRVAEEDAALVAPATGEQDVLAVERAEDLDEFRAVYAAAFGMPPGLAEALVVEADLAALPFLVGRVEGVAVACAQLRPGVDVAYVSGLGVLPQLQRRGYGSAMLAACRDEAGRLGRDLVWLKSGPANVPFYESVGFELVDLHVALTRS